MDADGDGVADVKQISHQQLITRKMVQLHVLSTNSYHRITRIAINIHVCVGSLHEDD